MWIDGARMRESERARERGIVCVCVLYSYVPHLIWLVWLLACIGRNQHVLYFSQNDFVGMEEPLVGGLLFIHRLETVVSVSAILNCTC